MSAVKAVAIGLLLLCGCHHERRNSNVVVLIDISASIDGGSGRMESAVYGVADKLRGGDEISVIPICDGGYAEASIPPLYFKVPEKREAFDEQLLRFRGQFKKRIQAILDVTPCKRTAIIEAIERSATLVQRGDKVLYIFTDGIEDAGISFYKDQRLGSSKEAAKLAKELAAGNRHMPETKIRLGLIDSQDFDKLPRPREDAIVAFWRSYLSELSADCQIEAPELLRD
jgi:hypothetical protein